MRALVIPENGNPDVLRVQERPDPKAGPGEVLIRVRASGINFADLMARQGIYPDAPDLPSVVGYEVAGEVAELGDGADGVQVGDRVMAGTRFGGYAELAVASAGTVIPLPEDWSFEEGAAFPVNYATAFAGIGRYGNLRPGEKLLVHAAAGGVGIATTQLAKLAGAEVFGTASGSKHGAIRGFGVDHPIDYRTTNFVKEIRRITGQKRPLDLVMDPQAGVSFRRSWSLLGAGGRLVGFGAGSAMGPQGRDLKAGVKMLTGTPIFHPIPMMRESKSFIGLNMLTLWDAKGDLGEYIEPLNAWIGAGKIRPVVAEAFPLERGPDAHRFIHERKNVGKVVLTV